MKLYILCVVGFLTLEVMSLNEHTHITSLSIAFKPAGNLM
jgi:hypothetical protein